MAAFINHTAYFLIILFSLYVIIKPYYIRSNITTSEKII